MQIVLSAGRLRAFAPLLAALVSCAAAPPRPSAVKGLSYTLRVEYRAEKPGDGAPTLHLLHHFTNHTRQTIHLSFQGDPLVFRAIGPSALFKIVVGLTHPSAYAGMPSPPTPDQLLAVPAGKSATYKSWRWLDALALNYDDRKRWRQYVFKRTGKVRVRACYNTSAVVVEAHGRLLPAGATLWQGEVCAPETSFEVKRLSRDAKDL